jgi:small subunit ribosomal protein S8e
MSVWHGDLHKRKPTGGKRRPYRGKRKFEQGSFPIETMLGEPKRKVERGRGGNIKIKVLSEKYACVTDIKQGKLKKLKFYALSKIQRMSTMTEGA